MENQRKYHQVIDDEKRTFDAIAAKGNKTLLHTSQYYKLYKLAGIRKALGNEKILEIGCGEGIHCQNFSSLGYKVTGIDISSGALKKAKAKCKKGKFINMPAQRLRFQDCSFDHVVFWGTLHHFYYADLDIVIQEATRVLKVNGTLSIIEPNDLYI